MFSDETLELEMEIMTMFQVSERTKLAGVQVLLHPGQEQEMSAQDREGHYQHDRGQHPASLVSTFNNHHDHSFINDDI